MISRKQFSTDVAGRTLTLEISPLAEQTNAAVVGHYGETSVLATVVMGEKDTDLDYLPLKVDYEEKFYAAGKIIGSRFIRREGRPSEEAILTGRLVDRTIRPLFDQRLRREIQAVVTVLAYDEENDPDFVGLLAVSTALGISDVPWGGPVAGMRLAKIGNRLVVNPTNTALQDPALSYETFVSGPEGSINMIELSGREAREEEILDGFAAAQSEISKLVSFQAGIIKEIGRPKAKVFLREPDPALREAVAAFLTASRLGEAVYQKDKKEYVAKMRALREELREHAGETFGEASLKDAEHLFDEGIDALVHKRILEKEERPDGRRVNEVRALDAEVGLFGRTHGSAVFTRGNTQALAVTTLASPGQAQLIETMETTGKRRFLLHYNFPPYSVHEIGSFRGPGRREIGHGALAEKALRPLIPSKEDFPYTIRVVSEILSSNGSSSMATVCAASLSLMDAGVPIKKPAAGIAMGLMMEGRGPGAEGRAKYKILTDIQGPEDHHGDMDFKAAGTEDGVTGIQMDVKVEGVTLEMLRATLAQAREARLEILRFMKSVLPAPRPELSPLAPKITTFTIPPEKIGMVIGSGGKTINALIKKYELETIDIEEDGTVYVAGKDMSRVKEVAEEIRELVREFKVGEIVEGPVVKTLDFGAIVDLGGGQDGMIHVSELKNGFVKNVGDVVKVGDVVRAKVIRVDADGRIGLSLKQLE
jgi:polyribonucleotide nucleotidyltransferase